MVGQPLTIVMRGSSEDIILNLHKHSPQKVAARFHTCFSRDLCKALRISENISFNKAYESD